MALPSYDVITQQVERDLLGGAGLTLADVERTLATAMAPGIDEADAYFQHTIQESWTLEDGRVKDASQSIEQGVGVRAISEEKTGFAYADELILPALDQASTAARAIARRGEQGRMQAWRRTPGSPLYQPASPLTTLDDHAKIALLERVDKAVRAMDSRVCEVVVSMSGVHEQMLVAAADGTLAADVRPLVRMNVSVIVESNGRREQGYAGCGGRYGLDAFANGERAIELGREAVDQALVNLEAGAAPAGPMTVVLGPGWPGILLHEAIGHGLEGDFNRKGTSAFSQAVGQKVASEYCTVVDDGTLPNRRGSLTVDDEGYPTQCTHLIENGVLKGYMQDKLNAKLMGVAATGNGRRESFAHLPMPRMTNTYMLPGPHNPEEIIASVDKGLYAANFGGGEVDITSGKFVFSASQAYLIEKGKMTRPVKGATLIGSGPDVLKEVSMVGDDLQLDAGVGTCGKEGQSVPVGVGQPTLKIDTLTVGGTG
ncbi:MAG: metalloprotease TldD [Pseudomonadota bacterium]